MSDEIPVFDHAAGPPWVCNEPITDAMSKAATQGESAADALKDAEVRQLQSDPDFREQVGTEYQSAGVNLVSITLGSDSSDPTYSEGVWRDIARWEARFEALDWS